MQIRKVTADDIELLIKLRLDYLREENKGQGFRSVGELKKKLRGYFEKWIETGGFVAFVAEENGDICSTAFLSVVERPPRRAFSSYLVGTVYNVYTDPAYRRRGIASRVMSALLEEAGALGVASVDLLATEAGRPLYEKLGFQVAKYTAMRIKLE